MDTSTLAIVGAAFFLSAFAKGMTGLGFSTACLPILALAIGHKATLPLLLVPSIASNIIVMVEARHFGASVRRFWLLFLSAVPGLVLGLFLLTVLDQAESGGVLGAVLFVYGVFALGNPGFRLPDRLEKPLAPVTGFLTGAINGLTGSQVMPVLPFMLALRMNRDEFVQAINCSFTFSSLVMAVGLSKIGLMTPDTALVSALGLVPVYVGIRLGGMVRRRLTNEIFRRLVLYMLMAGGMLLVLRAVAA
jgi:uncharacterized membrane protein YfcA